MASKYQVEMTNASETMVEFCRRAATAFGLRVSYDSRWPHCTAFLAFPAREGAEAFAEAARMLRNSRRDAGTLDQTMIRVVEIKPYVPAN
jgi:hypothetical protein